MVNSYLQQALEKVRNVATLPGIVGPSIAMPDIHWGYGFAIGGVVGGLLLATRRVGRKDAMPFGPAMVLGMDTPQVSAEHIDEVFSRSDCFTGVERREHDGEAPLDRPRTKFERRGLRKGHRICDWCFEKTM